MYRLPTFLVGLLSLAILPTVVGCVASLQAEPVYVEASDVPVNVEVYPHTYYEGRTVYLVNDHWYYRDGTRWQYYREEPAPLNRHRTYIQQAPPARRYVVSPPDRTARAVVAPPARRVQRERAHRRDDDTRESRGHER